MTDLTPTGPPDDPADIEETGNETFDGLDQDPDPFTSFDTFAGSDESEPHAGEPTKEENSFIGFLFELPILILVALVVAVVIKTFLIQAFFIPSGSMIPALAVDDRVMVNKLAYALGEPATGDIVVFDSPFGSDGPVESLLDKVVRNVSESLGLRTATAEDDLIKRVIASGGETVEIRDNQVLVNGAVIAEPYLAAGATMGDMELTEIPVGSVWVMGDNRSRSVDSRRFGTIDSDSIVGKAFVRMWPFDRFGGL